MGKRLRLFCGVALLSTALLVSSALFYGVTQAHAWGSATHAYIDDRIGKEGPVRNLNEIYGGMATDVFNYLFVNLDWLNYLYMETHYDHNTVVWEKANTILEKAAAFGFVSHNGYKGADATAHGTYDYGDPDGYVIAKAAEMAHSPEVYPYLAYLSLLDEQGVPVKAAYELCHTFVESAVDLLLARHDRSLGGKISAAALIRTREFPSLLVQAYAAGFAETVGLEYEAAARTIRSAEAEFRKNMMAFGLALAQEPESAHVLIAEQLVDLAPAFLGAYGVEIPEGADLMALSSYLLGEAMVLCENDYLSTVNRTIPFVARNLARMGIAY